MFHIDVSDAFKIYAPRGMAVTVTFSE